MLLNFMQQTARGMGAPTEVYPLLAVVGGAVIGGSYMGMHKLATDPHLRTSPSSPQHHPVSQHQIEHARALLGSPTHNLLSNTSKNTTTLPGPRQLMKTTEAIPNSMSSNNINQTSQVTNTSQTNQYSSNIDSGSSEKDLPTFKGFQAYCQKYSDQPWGAESKAAHQYYPKGNDLHTSTSVDDRHSHDDSDENKDNQAKIGRLHNENQNYGSGSMNGGVGQSSGEDRGHGGGSGVNSGVNVYHDFDHEYYDDDYY